MKTEPKNLMVSQLIEALELCPPNNDVSVPLKLPYPTIGNSPFVSVTHVNTGFDWDRGTTFLVPMADVTPFTDVHGELEDVHARCSKLDYENRRLKSELVEMKKNVISRFDEDKIPEFRQGCPEHELEGVVTAEDCKWMVREIVSLKRMICASAIGYTAYMDDGEASYGGDSELGIQGFDFLASSASEIHDFVQRYNLAQHRKNFPDGILSLNSKVE